MKMLARLLAGISPAGIERLGRFIGWVWYRLVPIRKSLAVENVAFAVTGGDREKAALIVKSTMINLCAGVLEFLAATVRGPGKVLVEGAGPLKEKLAAGRGVIAVTAHTGNWDLNEMMSTIEGVKLHLVSRKVALPGVQRFWEEARGKRGNVYLPQNVPATELLKVLKSGGCVTLAIDQNMPPKHGVRVPFFGREASTTFAPALLHLRTGAPIFPVFGGREPDGRYVVKALPELKFEKTGDFRADSEAITARLNSVLEDFIRSHPDQWLWMHRRWK